MKLFQKIKFDILLKKLIFIPLSIANFIAGCICIFGHVGCSCSSVFDIKIWFYNFMELSDTEEDSYVLS